MGLNCMYHYNMFTHGKIIVITSLYTMHAITHSVYLPLICECLPLNVQLELGVRKFFMNGINSTNRTFRFFI